jgi:rubrerythrin
MHNNPRLHRLLVRGGFLFGNFKKRLFGQKGCGEFMPSKTDENLARAFAEKSRLAARCRVFALKAKRQGHTHIARLFNAISEAETVHARRFLRLMRGKVKSSEENLWAVLHEEIKENVSRYPQFILEASEEGRNVAEEVFFQSNRVEDRHDALYQRATRQKGTTQATDYYVCQVCGNILEDRPPEKCPVCGAIRKKFKRID